MLKKKVSRVHESGEATLPQKEDKQSESTTSPITRVQTGGKVWEAKVGCTTWTASVAWSRIRIDEVWAFSVRMNVA